RREGDGLCAHRDRRHPGAHAVAQCQRDQPDCRRGRRAGDSGHAATARGVLRRLGDVHMSAVPLALIGMGKMGHALAALAPERGFRVVAEFDHERPDYAPVTRDTLRDAQVAIEFTMPEAAPANVRACAAAGCPIVVGTTGWYDQLPAVAAEIERAGGALLTAPNFSVGVAVFD